MTEARSISGSPVLLQGVGESGDKPASPLDLGRDTLVSSVSADFISAMRIANALAAYLPFVCRQTSATCLRAFDVTPDAPDGQVR
jgi:hypothetical protein